MPDSLDPNIAVYGLGAGRAADALNRDFGYVRMTSRSWLALEDPYGDELGPLVVTVEDRDATAALRAAGFVMLEATTANPIAPDYRVYTDGEPAEELQLGLADLINTERRKHA